MTSRSDVTSSVFEPALAWATPTDWVDTVLGDFGAFLVDHAACERKASATALSLACHYPDRKVLVDAMIPLAREELTHFHQVYRLLSARGHTLGHDSKDAYVRGLTALTRRGREEYFLDRLLLAGLIELRGTERFGLLAQRLSDEKLRTFYHELCASEAKHQRLFFDLAAEYFPAEVTAPRLRELIAAEAQVAANQPFRAALH